MITLLGHSLQLVVRGILRVYTSDTAYHAGLLLVLAILALTLTVGVIQHLPQPAPTDAPEVDWAPDLGW